ncbi:MAG: hypothetical protein LBP53_04125 [Candidatus Peribacteria bacterium]|jgi:hypothetical protein|nr:hypothetical protein [Candidatus Peribacteria bacterium]
MGIGIIGGICITAAWSSNVSSLKNLKSGNNNNTLTAANWDLLIDYLSGMDTEVQKTLQLLNQKVSELSGNLVGVTNNFASLTNSLTTLTNTVNVVSEKSVPAGAVMAFDLSACPTGWTRFSAADNRFIMGASSNFKTTGGSSYIYLSANQLPSHSHYLFYRGEFRGKGGRRMTNGAHANDTVYSKNKGTDGDNNHRYDTVGIQNQTANAGKSSSVGNGASINIQNPYIKLIYCKKN